jgi:hypothetical protein
VVSVSRRPLAFHVYRPLVAGQIGTASIVAFRPSAVSSVRKSTVLLRG